MKPVARSTVAIILGTLVALISNVVMDPLFLALPTGIDMENKVAVRRVLAEMPREAFFLIVAGWGLGAFAGGWIAAWIAGRAPFLHAGAVGTLMMLATMANLFALPHPQWVNITAPVVSGYASLLGGFFGSRTRLLANSGLNAAYLVLAWIALGAAVPCVQAEPLQAAAARVDITPPTGHPLWGYAVRRNNPSVGVRDPLYARAAVLTVGKNSMAIVSLDLGRPPTRRSMEAIRKQVKEATGIETLFLVASHTHHGPVLELDNWPTKEKPYVVQLQEKITQAIVEAYQSRRGARIGIVAEHVPFTRNRHSKRANPPVDDEMVLVRIEDAQQMPIAHLVNFAAHPVMLPARLCEFSADFPGTLAKHVEKELGGVCLFLQGAAGDLSPKAPGEATPEKYGAALGEFVARKCAALKCDHADMKNLAARERDFKFSSRVDISNPFVYAAYSLAFFPGLVDFYEREYREGVRPHLTTALLDDRVGFVGVSGEFFCSHAVHLKKRARLEHLLFLGYCNDYQQYFPTIEAAAEGGYGADSTVAPAEVGSGERVMDQALIDLLALARKAPQAKR